MVDLEFIDRLSRRTGEVLSFVFLISVGVMGWEVAARYIFGAPTIWAHETTICLTAIGFVFGGVYTLQRREHIRITSLYDLAPSWLRKTLDLICSIIILFYLVALIYGAWIVAERSWMVMETSGSAWNQPIPVVLKTTLVLGLVLMALQALTHFLQQLGLVRRKGISDEKPPISI